MAARKQNNNKPRVHPPEAPAPGVTPSTEPRWLRAAAAVVSLLLGAGFGVYHQTPHFWSPLVCNDDARQQLYWMDRFHNPALFQNDIVVDYAAHYVSAGVKAVFWVATFFAPAIPAGKCIAVALFALLGYWCYRIGEKLLGPGAGLAAAILVVTSVPVADRVVGGNPRGFMYPLLAAWLCYLLRGEHWKLAGVAVASALFYPMAFVLAVPVWVLDAAGFDGWRPRLDLTKKRWLPTLIGLGAGGLALVGPYAVPDSRFGPLADRQRVMNDPAFRKGGRFAEVLGSGNESAVSDVIDAAGTPLGRRGRWEGESWMRRNAAWQTGALAALVVVWIALAALRIAPLPKAFAWLAASSVLTYGLAWLLVFRLFVPTRYVQFSLPLLVLLGMALTVAGPLRRWRDWRLATMANVALAAALAYGLSQPRPRVPVINNTGTGFWTQIEKIVPVDAVIAGHPTYLDSLGAFARRKAFMPDELAHPAYTTYYHEVVTKRINATFDALFAESPEEVLRFARENHVDYLLFGTKDLARGGQAYIEPFNRRLAALMQDGRPRCLLSVPRERVLTAVRSGPPGNEIRLIRISPGPDNAFGVTSTQSP